MTAPPKKAGPRCSYKVTLLWCPDQPKPPSSASRRNSIFSLSSLDTFLSRYFIDTRAPPPAPTTPETAITPAAIVPELAPETAKPAPKTAPKRAPKPASKRAPKQAAKPAPKQAANRAHKRQI